MPRFYTRPPREIPYPYILVNANNPAEGLRYIQHNKPVIEAVILDSGVEIFRDPRVREYPGGPEDWIRHVVGLWRRVRSILPDAEVYATVPDYPDDYHPRALWISEETTNIERTVRNVELALAEHPDVDWLIPVQGHYEKPESIEHSLQLLEEAGALEWAAENTRYLAVAMLCTSKKCGTIRETILAARRWLDERGYRELRLHVFGPAVNCVRGVAGAVYSWDSMAWTRPRAPGGRSAGSSLERRYLFLTWIHRYADLIDLPPHPASMRRGRSA